MENKMQCVGGCPVQQLDVIVSKILDPNTVVIVSTAPAPRVALGEVFGESGNAQGKIVGFLKSIGVDYVFDTTFGADLTTICEARELLCRLDDDDHLPLLNSCCPAFVKFIQNFYPSLKNNISTTFTPIANMGTYIKAIFARELNVSPRQIFHIALTPCVAKKIEIKDAKFVLKNFDKNTKYSTFSKRLSANAIELLHKIKDNHVCDARCTPCKSVLQNGDAPIYLTDAVITTNELANLIKLSGLAYNEIQPLDCDKISGNAIQFGHSGGVVKSVCECAYYLTNGKRPPKTFFGLKQLNDYAYVANLKIGNHKIKVAKIDGLKNMEDFISNNDVKEYAFIEVMTCAGGCLGGTGQPKSADLTARKKLLLQNECYNSAEDTLAMSLINKNPNLFLNKPN